MIRQNSLERRLRWGFTTLVAIYCAVYAAALMYGFHVFEICIPHLISWSMMLAWLLGMTLEKMLARAFHMEVGEYTGLQDPVLRGMLFTFTYSIPIQAAILGKYIPWLPVLSFAVFLVLAARLAYCIRRGPSNSTESHALVGGQRPR